MFRDVYVYASQPYAYATSCYEDPLDVSHRMNTPDDGDNEASDGLRRQREQEEQNTELE